MQSDLEIALNHHRAGRLAEAEALYRKVLAVEPSNANVLNLLGVMASQRGQFEAGIELGSRAVSLSPGNAEYLVNLGESLRRAGRVGEALETFERACAADEQSAPARYNCALTLAAMGRKDEALAGYQKAAELAPTWGQVQNNLGLLLHERGDFAGAVEAFQRALAHNAGQGEVCNNLGLALWKMQRHEEALAAFDRATLARPDLAAAHANAGVALRKMGRRQEAIARLRRACDLDAGAPWIRRDLALAYLESGDAALAAEAARRAVDLSVVPADAAESWHTLGVILAVGTGVEETDPPGAVTAYERALALRPESAAWRFELAALRGEHATGAPDAFVQALFDEYAPRFEKHLVEGLKYRVPEELLAATLELSAAGTLRRPPWDILDMGCGTGRGGELFRAQARRLVGIDLAPNMIALSRRRGVYDELRVSHVVPALGQSEEAWDLILAADLFIYVGALEEIFAGAAKALRPGGVLAFSIEHHEGSGFALHRRQRFAHSLAYVRAAAERVGLREVLVRRITLRNDVPPGWIMCFARS